MRYYIKGIISGKITVKGVKTDGVFSFDTDGWKWAVAVTVSYSSETLSAKLSLQTGSECTEAGTALNGKARY